MTKKITLASIASQIERLGTRLAKNDGRFDRLEGLMEKGFAAAKADLKTELKTDISRVQDQVNSIEAQLRLGRYETRLGNLEEKVFGAPRR